MEGLTFSLLEIVFTLGAMALIAVMFIFMQDKRKTKTLRDERLQNLYTDDFEQFAFGKVTDEQEKYEDTK